MVPFDDNESELSGSYEPAEPIQEAAQPQEPRQSETGTYHAQGTGRRESPYASSPYVMNSQPRDEYFYQYQPAQKAPKKEKVSGGHSIWRSVVACILTVALVAGGCLITAGAVNSRWEKRSAEAIGSLNEKIEALEQQIASPAAASTDGAVVQQLPSDGSQLALTQLYSQSVSSVVAISSTVESSNYFGQTTEGTASGSGFILSADGYVVTNYHVVEGAKALTVILHDGTEYTATLKGYDSTNDIAVLKVDATDLPAAPLGKSGALSIGDMVVAIGNPLGTLTATQTVGYVSGINREVATDSSIISMIQTDAAINPGNSGGPLFNMQGQVIGITTAKYSGTTGSGASIEGIGFAIPIDDVMPIINDLVSHGYVTGAYMGITVQNTDADSAAMFGLPTGAYVLEVVKGGSADRAGIQPKDIIISLGDTTVTNVTDLTRALRSYKAGDETTVTLIRAGQETTLSITLDEKPQQTEDTTPQQIPQPDENMPSSGNYEDWFNWFFGGRGGK